MAAGIVIHALAAEQDIRKMGGLRQADAAHVLGVPDRLARARRHLPVRRASSRRTRSSPRRWTHGAYGYVLWVVGARRHVPDGPLHVPAALHRLLGRAERVRARALPRAEERRRRRRRWQCRSACSPSLSVDRRLDPVVAVLASRRRRGWRPSRSRSSSPRATGRRRSRRPRGRARTRRDRRGVAAVRRQAPRRPAVGVWQRLLEHKLYFDEAYDAVVLPARGLARARARRGRRAARDRGRHA